MGGLRTLLFLVGWMFLLPTLIFAQSSENASFVPGNVIVKFLIDVEPVGTSFGIASIDRIGQRYGLLDVKKVFSAVDSRGRNIGLHRVYLLKFSNDTNITAAIEDYNVDSNIDYAEPNFITAADFIPNDPFYNQQWSLQKTNLEDAWDIERGKKDVVIAILDTGVQLNHPDLDDNIWNNSDEFLDGLDNDGNGFIDDLRGWDFVDNETDASDEDGHGTHVAGIVAGKGHNSIGVAGVCMNCSIMPVRVLGGENISLDVAEGMNYAIINNASIISMSLNIGACNVVSSLLDDMANLAYSSGIVISKSAGNDNENCRKVFTTYNIIMVAASDEGDEKAIFSNYGGWNPYFNPFTGTIMKTGAVVDVTAPGVSILSTTMQSDYGFKQGTSMSTPFVSGLAGLLLSENSSLTVEQVKALIKSTADKPALNNKFYIGIGRVNASRALQNANKNPAVARINHTGLDGGFFTGAIAINGTANGQTFSQYHVEAADVTWPNSNVYNANFVNIASSNSPVDSGILTIFSPTTSGKYIIRIRVVNTVGFESIDQVFVTVSLNNQCGDVSSNNVLSNKVVSLDSDFSSTCFNIVQDDVVFDCANKSISGVGFGTAIAAIGRNNVTIKNCLIEGFETSVSLIDTNSSIVRNIRSMSDTNPGDIILQNSFNNKIINNDIFTGGFGFTFGISGGYGDGNTISNNTVSATRLASGGIALGGKSNLVKGNVVSIVGASETSFMPAFAIFTGTGKNNSVIGNNVTTTMFAVGVAVSWYGSSNNNVSYNRFKMLGKNGIGIVVDGVDGKNTITNNLVLTTGDNAVGILLKNAFAEQEIKSNNITVNNSIGLVLLSYTYDLVNYRHIIPDSNYVNSKLIKYVRNKSNLIIDGSNIGQFICVDCKKITLSNANMTGGNLFLVNTTNSTFKNMFIKTSRSTAQLILSDRNRFISNSFLTSSGFESIVLVGSSNNTFIASNVTVKKLDEFADEYTSFGLYDYITGNTTNSANNLAKDMLLKNENVTVSFRDGLGTSLGSVNEIFLPPNPPGKVDINKFIRLSSNNLGSWIAINISYKDSDLAGVAENTLKIWMFDDNLNQWVSTGFYAGQNGVNAANNVVFANLTPPSTNLFGVFGDFSIATTTSTTSSTTSTTSTSSTTSISTTSTSSTTSISTTSTSTSTSSSSTTTIIPLSCGQNITSNSVMTVDLTCFIGGSENALRINANNISLDCSGHIILGNGTGTGILVGNRTGVSIKNCNVINFLSGIIVSTGNANRFLSNRFINNGNLGQGFGLGIGSKNNIVYNNAFTGNYFGLALFGPGTGSSAFYNNISRNKFSSNRYAIRVESHNNTIVNNLINNSITHGIEIAGSAKFNNITKNTILNSIGSGINLAINTNRNTISRNSISKNDIGIFLFDSFNNMIYSNNISDNNNGIGIASASGNLIYNNYFKNIIGNADDASGINYWNTTKTSGTNIVGGPFIAGNFWHDYNGQDTNGDLIGDTNLPYKSGGSIVNGGDYLPLTQFTIATTNFVNSCSNDPNQAGLWKVSQDLSSSGSTCLDVLINDVILDCQGHSITGTGISFGVNINQKNNVTIKNCVIKNYASGIAVEGVSGCSNIKIINNTLSNNDDFGLVVACIAANNMKVSNNKFLSNGFANFNSGGGIQITGANHNISGNNFTNNNVFGIDNNADNTIIANNKFKGNLPASNAYPWNGIRMFDVVGGSINGNDVQKHDVGIKLTGSNGVSINGNTLANNIVDIYIDPSNNNQIINNLITSATSGIQIDNSTGNLVRRNNISESTFGIILKGSNANFIYDNYFMRNNFNAQDRDGSNYWNTTKQSGQNILGGNIIGGNFWFDYKGQDSNNDGVGDTDLPYNSGNRIRNGGDYIPLYKTFVTGGPSPGPGQHKR